MKPPGNGARTSPGAKTPNEQGLSPAKLRHHPGPILPIPAELWEATCTLSLPTGSPQPWESSSASFSVKPKLHFSNGGIHSLREQRGPLAWQVRQLGLCTCNFWEAKGFTGPSMPITRGRRCHFHSKDKADSSGLTSPHKIQQKTGEIKERKNSSWLPQKCFQGKNSPMAARLRWRIVDRSLGRLFFLVAFLYFPSSLPQARMPFVIW